MALPQAVAVLNPLSVMDAVPAGAAVGTATLTVAMTPFPIGVALSADTMQLTSVVPAGGAGLVGTAQVTALPAAVAVGPAVTVKPLTDGEGAERVNWIEAGSRRVVLEEMVSATDPPGVAVAVVAVQARLTVLLESRVKVT